MPMYLCFDGGGSASRALLFDQDGPIGYGRSGGTNTNFTSREDCRRNIADCLEQALAGVSGPAIDTLYFVIVGPGEVLEEELRQRAQVKEILHMAEGYAGLLAGALRTTGMVALSGTGSDSFYIRPDGSVSVVGAYGSILGDDGSGFWIAQRAMRKAVAYSEGWGEPTAFLELIQQRWDLKNPKELIRAVHGTPAPFRKVASALPVVAEAARGGDRVCLELFRKAGRLMAEQTFAVIRREQPPEEDRLCVCCGGAWKAHPMMYETFVGEMAAGAPDVQVRKPLFEHLMAGVVAQEMKASAGSHPEELARALAERYAQYKTTW